MKIQVEAIMKVQVLISTMNQKDFEVLNRLCVESDAVVVNQCDEESTDYIEYNGFKVCWINSKSRGLSHSRNLALYYSDADICLLCDDDEVLTKNYVEILCNAYDVYREADIITFNFKAYRGGVRQLKRNRNKNRKSPFYRYYTSMAISFRRMSIKKNGLFFNELIGAGTRYGCGEESLFINKCRKNGLQIYERVEEICSVDFSKSSWFNGFNENFYFNIGIFLRMAYGKFALLFALYYMKHAKSITNLGGATIFSNIIRGVKHYDEL